MGRGGKRQGKKTDAGRSRVFRMLGLCSNKGHDRESRGEDLWGKTRKNCFRKGEGGPKNKGHKLGAPCQAVPRRDLGRDRKRGHLTFPRQLGWGDMKNLSNKNGGEGDGGGSG